MPSLDHPYDLPAGGRWMRGNLHTHTNRSDGTSPIQEVIDLYADHGHGFLMISDHDCFGDAQFLAALDSKGMVLIPGNEISAQGPHMLQVGGVSGVEPRRDRQAIIDEALAQGSMVIANHPNWGPSFNHFPHELLESLQGYMGIEIYNGVIGRLPGSPYATDRWQRLLDQGRPLWGFANDDYHRKGIDSITGWNTAWVTDHSLDGVLDALSKGRFYPSTGVTITQIHVDGMTITIETEDAVRICALVDGSKRLATADDRAITFTVPDDVRNARFECWGHGESFAWTQPFAVRLDG